MSKQFSDDEQFKLMTSKGVYPYEYIDNYNKLHETQLLYGIHLTVIQF